MRHKQSDVRSLQCDLASFVGSETAFSKAGEAIGRCSAYMRVDGTEKKQSACAWSCRKPQNAKKKVRRSALARGPGPKVARARSHPPSVAFRRKVLLLAKNPVPRVVAPENLGRLVGIGTRSFQIGCCGLRWASYHQYSKRYALIGSPFSE